MTSFNDLTNMNDIDMTKAIAGMNIADLNNVQKQLARINGPVTQRRDTLIKEAEDNLRSIKNGGSPVRTFDQKVEALRSAWTDGQPKCGLDIAKMLGYANVGHILDLLKADRGIVTRSGVKGRYIYTLIPITTTA